MTRRRGPWLAAAAALLAAGCGQVIVHHILPPANLPAEHLARLARLAIVINLDPPDMPAGILGTTLKAFNPALYSDEHQSLALPRLEAQSLMNNAAAALSAPGTGMVGCFVAGPGATAFLDGLNATAVLRIVPTRLLGRQSAGELETEDPQSRKKKLTKVYTQQMDCSFTYRLEAWPERTVLAQRTFPADFSAQTAEPVALKEWVLAQSAVRSNWLAGLQRDLLPSLAARGRKLKKNPSPDVKAGYDAAMNNRWEDAGQRWNAEFARNPSLEVIWDLGIWAEHEGRFAEARTWYERARGMTAKSGDRMALDIYLRQMDMMFAGGAAVPPPAAGPGWFDGRTAVIPFGNETNNVGSPERVRAAAWKELARKGYPLVSLADTDTRVRAIGLSQGDQVKAFDPAKIVAATGAVRVLTGTVTQFKTVNVGIYQAHVVVVQYRLLDAAGRDLWSAPGYGVHEIVVRPGDAGKAFLGGLIGTTLDKMTNSYLEAEISDAVLTGLESLPARPGPVQRRDR